MLHCPECTSAGPFDIWPVSTQVVFDQVAEDRWGMEVVGDLEWDTDSSVRCHGCNAQFGVTEFIERTGKFEKEGTDER